MLGVSEDRFWDATPVELEPYRTMDAMMQERRDYDMWLMGAYVTNAVGVAVSNALNGKKSHAKYLDKPFSAMAEEEANDPESDFKKFSAWAIVFNENFKGRNGQG